MSRWWRAYDEALHDPKLQRLGGTIFKFWFNIMCIASKNGGVLPRLCDIAYAVRLNEDRTRVLIDELKRCGLLDETPDGFWSPHNWEGRQFPSDVSTDRVKRFRNRQRNVSETVQNRTEEIREEENRTEQIPKADAFGSVDGPTTVLKPRRLRRNKTPLPENFQPDRDFPRGLGWAESRIDQQIQAFCNSANAHGRVYADWPAAWRSWCVSPYQQPGNQHGTAKQDRQSELKNALEQLGDYIETPRENGDVGSAPILFLPAARRG